MRTRCVLCVMAVAALSACAVGPEYVRPSAPASTKWDAMVARSGSTMHGGVADQWWVIFKDSDLNEIETNAIANNQSLEAAAARVLEARALAQAQMGAYYPSLALNSSLIWKEGLLLRSEHPDLRSKLNDLALPLDMSYEVDVWGRIRRQVQAAKALADATEETKRVILLGLQSDVAWNYFQLRSLDLESEILDRAIKRRSDVLAWTRQRVKAGMAAQADVRRAEGELASTRAEQGDVLLQREKFQNAIAVLLGVPAADFSVVVSTRGFRPPQIPADISSDLLKRRPDVSQAERLAAAASAQIGVAKASLFPRVYLTGSLGYESSRLKTLPDWSSRMWALGPVISVPIFSGWHDMEVWKAAKAAYDSTVAGYRSTMITAFREVKDAMDEISHRNELSDHHRQAVESAGEAMSILDMHFRHGDISYFEMRDGQRTLLAAERMAQQNAMNRQVGYILLIKALGGGWDAE